MFTFLLHTIELWENLEGKKVAKKKKKDGKCYRRKYGRKMCGGGGDEEKKEGRKGRKTNLVQHCLIGSLPPLAVVACAILSHWVIASSSCCGMCNTVSLGHCLL